MSAAQENEQNLYSDFAFEVCLLKDSSDNVKDWYLKQNFELSWIFWIQMYAEIIASIWDKYGSKQEHDLCKDLRLMQGFWDAI